MTKDEIQSIFGSHIVSFHAIFAKAIGSVPAAVMLSQAFFWQEKAKNKEGIKIGEEMFFSKTGEEWYDETGLTESQQLTARKHLLAAGFWIEQRAGLPAKMCYRIDIEILVAVISRYLKNGLQVAVDNRHKLPQNTRDSSGKFRQLEAVKNGDNIKERELKGELKEKKGECAASPLSSPFKKTNEFLDLEAEKEKSLQTGAGGEPKNGQAATRLTIHDPEAPGVTIYDHIPHKGYPTHEPAGEFERVNIPEEVERMRNGQTVLEGFVIGRKLPRDKFAEYLDAFEVEQVGLETKYKNVRELRLHFQNWSCIRFGIAQRKATQSTRSKIVPLGGDSSRYGEKQKF